MPGRKQQSRPAPLGDWLRRDESRKRPWALAQQLFEPTREQVEREPPTLDRLERQLLDQARRIGELEARLAQLPVGEQDAPREQPSGPRRTVALRRQNGPDRDFWLAHCEGFLVESPEGPVGVVEAVHFGSRLDLPDEVEIRAGRFRSVELVLPVEEIEDVDPEEKLLRLAHDPRSSQLPARSLLRRLDSFVSTTFR